jgi:hypothetical protein
MDLDVYLSHQELTIDDPQYISSHLFDCSTDDESHLLVSHPPIAWAGDSDRVSIDVLHRQEQCVQDMEWESTSEEASTVTLSTLHLEQQEEQCSPQQQSSPRRVSTTQKLSSPPSKRKQPNPNVGTTRRVRKKCATSRRRKMQHISVPIRPFITVQELIDTVPDYAYSKGHKNVICCIEDCAYLASTRYVFSLKCDESKKRWTKGNGYRICAKHYFSDNYLFIKKARKKKKITQPLTH